MRIYLVHPGENGAQGLTENGVWQIETLVRQLIKSDIKVDRVYANGHEASRESGDILSKSLRVPLVCDERFIEVNKMVILGEINDFELENLDYVNLFVDEIVSKGKDAIITIGGGIHRAVISRLTGIPLSETRHFSLFPASLSSVQYSNNEMVASWKISFINDTTHLRVP